MPRKAKEFDAVQEDRINEAISYYSTHPGLKKTKVANQFWVKYRTFCARLNSTPLIKMKGGYNMLLSADQNKLTD
jgi:hypothetical protein